MNKSQLMYDMVKAWQNKEMFKGQLKVQGSRDGKSFLNFSCDFEKNIKSGEVKCGIKTEVDAISEKFKHQGNTEFSMNFKDDDKAEFLAHCHHRIDDCFHHRLHDYLHLHHDLHHNHVERIDSIIQNNLALLSFRLHLLNNIEMIEQADRSVKVSLLVEELPPEIKEIVSNKMKNYSIRGHYGEDQSQIPGSYTTCMKTLQTMKNVQLSWNMDVSPEKDLKKWLLTIKGEQIDEKKQAHNCQLLIELNME